KKALLRIHDIDHGWLQEQERNAVCIPRPNEGLEQAAGINGLIDLEVLVSGVVELRNRGRTVGQVTNVRTAAQGIPATCIDLDQPPAASDFPGDMHLAAGL